MDRKIFSDKETEIVLNLDSSWRVEGLGWNSKCWKSGLVWSVKVRKETMWSLLGDVHEDSVSSTRRHFGGCSCCVTLVAL